jgi:hypothetical protein
MMADNSSSVSLIIGASLAGQTGVKLSPLIMHLASAMLLAPRLFISADQCPRVDRRPPIIFWAVRPRDRANPTRSAGRAERTARQRRPF